MLANDRFTKRGRMSSSLTSKHDHLLDFKILYKKIIEFVYDMSPFFQIVFRVMKSVVYVHHEIIM